MTPVKLSSVHRLVRVVQRCALGVSFLTLVVFAWAYLRQPDLLAALTYLPVWLWAMLGIPLALLGLTRRRTRLPLVLAALWLVYLGALAEEPWSILRRPQADNPTWQAARFEGRGIRVVSLNCGAEETVAAAEEVVAHSPDLVLLQEAPDIWAIRRLAQRLYGDGGDIAYFPDRAIIAAGMISQSRRVADGGMLRARVALHTGLELEVFCLHFISPARRRNMLAPDYFREQTRRRHVRQMEMAAVAREVANVPNGMPLLVGGDFNAPQRDPAYRLLRPRLRDSFAEAGLGWGNTILNHLPGIRIDRVWISQHFRPVAVRTFRTRHSDHRMVVCDLIVAE